jgi:hypothetical protein
MRHNEQPVPFKDECTPHGDDGYFYTVAELKRCLD